MIEISVIVPTRNRATFLETCLISLCEQTIDPSRFEICVVNNGSTDNTPEVVEKIAARYPKHNLFTVLEPALGLSRARNRGLEETKAPLAANIDDDGSVYPDWLERFLARFAELGDDVAVVSGEIEPIWAIPRPEWLTDKMLPPISARSSLGTEAHFLSESEWLLEGNACYRRKALEEAGRYPENLGRVGDCLLSCEGPALEKRLRKNGWREFFDPKIILRHYIHANRIAPLWFRQRYFWQGVSDYAVREYNVKHGIPVDGATYINLPLNAENWGFVFKDTPDNLEESAAMFQSLGFILALTGILPIEN